MVIHFDQLKPCPADMQKRDHLYHKQLFPWHLVEDSDEVISPEELNLSVRANEIDSEPSSSFTPEGSGNANSDLQVLPPTVSAPRRLSVSGLEIDTVTRVVENKFGRKEISK